MRVTGQVHVIEAQSAIANVSDDGLSAVIAFVSAVDGAHYRMTLSRQLFDRLALQITREQTRVPKPVRRRSSAHEAICV